VKLPNET
jgi:hypothetical protein